MSTRDLLRRWAGQPRRVNRGIRAGLVLVGSTLVVAAMSAVHGAAANASATTPSCIATSVAAPIVGAWHTQAYFPGQPFPGQTENLLLTFNPGGTVNQVSPQATSRAAVGTWRINQDCTYSVHTVNFFYATNNGVSLIANVYATYVADDNNHIHDTSLTGTTSFYDPTSGQLLANSPGGGPNPLFQTNQAQITGVRITDDWQAPSQLPPMP